MKKVFRSAITAVSLCTLISCTQINKQPSLKDDFYKSVNYEWLNTTQIPETSFRTSSFDESGEIVNAQIKEMLESNDYSSNEEKQSQIFYNQIINLKSEQVGLSYAKSIVSQLESFHSLNQLLSSSCSENFPDCSPISCSYLSTDQINTNLFVPSFFYNMILGTYQQYFDLDSKESQRVFALTKEYYTKMLEKLGWSKNPVETIESLFEFEKSIINQCSITPDGRLCDIETTNMYFPNLKLIETVQNKGCKNTKFGINGMDFFLALNKAYTEENLEMLKSLYVCSFIQKYANFIDEESKIEAFRLKQNLNKLKAAYPEEIITFSLLDEMAEPVSIAWVNNYFSEEVRQDVTNLTQEVVDAYKIRLSKSDWISERTKQQAINKLDSMKFFIGYPQTVNDYSDLHLEDSASLLESTIKIRKFTEKNNISIAADYNKKDRWLYGQSTQANAYYLGNNNSFNICAGILNGNFYNKDWPKEKKLGGIGAAIAHEISHGFDSQGGYYDADGNYILWWDQIDFKTLYDKSKKYTDYLDTLVHFKDVEVNSDIWMAESVADLGAMAATLEIASTIPNFNYDIYFRQFAIIFRSLYEESYQKYIFSFDPHPVSKLRVNATLQTFDEFYKTYDIKPGDKMYLAPEDRTKIW